MTRVHQRLVVQLAAVVSMRLGMQWGALKG